MDPEAIFQAIDEFDTALANSSLTRYQHGQLMVAVSALKQRINLAVRGSPEIMPDLTAPGSMGAPDGS